MSRSLFGVAPWVMLSMILICLFVPTSDGSPSACPNEASTTHGPEALMVSHRMREELRTRLEAAGTPPQISVGPASIRVSEMLPDFYARRMYQPAWSNDAGPLPHVDALLDALHDAEREGLRSSDYQLAHIEATLGIVRDQQAQQAALDPCNLVELDLQLTNAFFRYGTHVQDRRITPATIDAAKLINRREVDLANVLQTALDGNAVGDGLRSLVPQHPGYMRLRKALARYRDLAAKEGWPLVPEGQPLQKGTRSDRVVALRTRLVVAGDLDPARSDDGRLFDEALEHAVRRFQWRHGLGADGVVGPSTLAALNVPVEARVRQLELNMERWRWLPQQLGDRHIRINIANFALEVVEDGRPVLTMPVIVGRPDRPTPSFSAYMSHLVLRPYWQVPPSIAIADKLPLFRKDPSYVTKQRFRIFPGWGAEGKPIDPHTIDWSQVSAHNFNYRLRQDPGPLNALGRVKFMLLNPFNVYLHDTPSRNLFSKPVRALSSGCIRLADPIALAEYVLRDDHRWPREKILDAIEHRTQHTVRLPEPIPVHLLYATAWVDEDGSIHFRQDIYDEDQALEQALREERLLQEQKDDHDPQGMPQAV
ncbi:MAG: L,D-transpeptidase family protein [Nitrospinae bacterium]|nr:L,D-transpeptidase family protein [Nitrospinota bacterium]